MTFTKEINDALSAKLDPAAVKSRTQAGRTLSYVEGWHAIAEANRIFGFDGWTRETVDCRMVAERERAVGQGTGWGVSYVARVRVTVGSLVREGIGAGHGIDRDLGLAHESAIKEAETDAMKRALMTFGWPFGLALYDKSQEHVEKQEPAPKAASPAKPAAPAAVADFWKRASYELPGNDLLAIAGKFVKATEAAPTDDALLKLEDDNKDHLAAIKNGSASDWQKVQTALSAARKRLTVLAA
jgi:DNA repair and recombination protein RAD52